MTGTVVVVNPYSSGNMYAPAFRRAGFDPVAVVTREDSALAGTLRLEDFDAVIRYDGDADALRSRVAELDPVAIIPGADTGVALADRLAADLTPSLANDVVRSSARRHKGAMVSTLAAHGVPVIRTLSTADADEVSRWLAESGLEGRDLVVKPAASAGSDGVALVPGGRDWRSTFHSLLGSVSRLGERNEQVVVQEYVTGTEYVIDAFSHRGTHSVTAISRYHKVRNGSHIAVYDRIEILPYDEPGHRPLVDYLKRVLDALGVSFGVTHTEIMLTDRGPLLIETHMRPSGGGQPWVCQLATGDNQIDRMVRWLQGDRTLRHDYDLEIPTLVVYFIVKRAGRVGNTAVLSEIEDLVSCYHLQVNVKDDDLLSETADMFDSLRLGVVVLAHEDRGQLMADYAALRSIEGSLVVTDEPSQP